MTDYLELKANLLVGGVNADTESLRRLGTDFKEQNHGLFGWDFEDHTDMVLPDDFSDSQYRWRTILQWRTGRCTSCLGIILFRSKSARPC